MQRCHTPFEQRYRRYVLLYAILKATPATLLEQVVAVSGEIPQFLSGRRHKASATGLAEVFFSLRIFS